MLRKLSIENVALIDSAEIEFSDGLNVLSGETGAGKSVVIEAINFVLGAKADKTLIRSGENECKVTADFFVEPSLLGGIFSELDIDEENEIIVTRRFSSDGKGSVKVNGCSVTLGMLKKLTRLLVDIHSQSEHFSLLSETNQLALIDGLSEEKDISDIKQRIKEKNIVYKNVLERLNELGGDESRRLMRLDVLEYQIKEISEADIKDGEEEELVEIKNKLSSREKIIEAMQAVKYAINEDGGANDILANVMYSLRSIGDLDKEYADIYDRLSAACAELEDVSECADGVIGRFDDVDVNPDYVEERLELIKKIKKKYGATYEEIMRFLTDATEEKNRLDNFGELSEQLVKEGDVLKADLYDLFCELSNKRRKSAECFENKVVDELKTLGMPHANFQVRFCEQPNKEDCAYTSLNGFDKVEFLFTANIGEPLKPLSDVISGGELSRFMLAVKSQEAAANVNSTYVFDEIDAGISGVMAKSVAEKYVKIAKNVQIIAISHLSQIAATADCNLFIWKTESDGKAHTNIKRLTAEEKIYEVARLSGGTADNKSTFMHAEQLIKEADAFKKTAR